MTVGARSDATWTASARCGQPWPVGRRRASERFRQASRGCSWLARHASDVVRMGAAAHRGDGWGVGRVLEASLPAGVRREAAAALLARDQVAVELEVGGLHWLIPSGDRILGDMLRGELCTRTARAAGGRGLGAGPRAERRTPAWWSRSAPTSAPRRCRCAATASASSPSSRCGGRSRSWPRTSAGTTSVPAWCSPTWPAPMSSRSSRCVSRVAGARSSPTRRPQGVRSRGGSTSRGGVRDSSSTCRADRSTPSSRQPRSIRPTWRSSGATRRATKQPSSGRGRRSGRPASRRGPSSGRPASRPTAGSIGSARSSASGSSRSSSVRTSASPGPGRWGRQSPALSGHLHRMLDEKPAWWSTDALFVASG